jgi:predicted RNase H-like HicB family nuclease
MIQYPVVLEQEADGRFAVSAPDLPGCQSWGEAREEALDRIGEAISLWLGTATEAGIEVPEPGVSIAYVPLAA